MKKIILLSFLCLGFLSNAQIFNPVTWDFSQSKISDAFSLKKDWANFIINTSISSSSIANANNYLETIYEKNEVFDESDIKKPNLKKFYIFGPGSLGDPNPKYKDFILVHLKPHPNLLESFKKEILFKEKNS